jgi:hypothetical protein
MSSFTATGITGCSKKLTRDTTSDRYYCFLMSHKLAVYLTFRFLNRGLNDQFQDSTDGVIRFDVYYQRHGAFMLKQDGLPRQASKCACFLSCCPTQEQHSKFRFRLLENAWIVGTTHHAYILQMLVSHEQGGLRWFLR